jgi:phasin family protein
MQETRRMAEEAKRIGEETQAHVKRAGEAYQNAVESGFEAATHSFGETNRGFQNVAAEITNFSKKRLEDVAQAWEQVLRAKSFGDVMEVQSRYAQKAYEDYTSQMSRLGEIYLDTVRNAAKPVQETSKRFT